MCLMNSLNRRIKWDGPHTSSLWVPGGTALAEWQSGMPAISLQEVYRKQLQAWVLRVDCSARGGQWELRMASRHKGSAFPSQDLLWWPSQESRAGLVTAAWVSQDPGVTRQVHRDEAGPEPSQEVRSVCNLITNYMCHQAWVWLQHSLGKDLHRERSQAWWRLLMAFPQTALFKATQQYHN